MSESLNIDMLSIANRMWNIPDITISASVYDPIFVSVRRLQTQRKKIAKMYFNGEGLSYEAKTQLIEQFSECNRQLIEILGLKTLNK